MFVMPAMSAAVGKGEAIDAGPVITPDGVQLGYLIAARARAMAWSAGISGAPLSIAARRRLTSTSHAADVRQET